MVNKKSHPYFIPENTQGSRRETAILLVGTAEEHGIPQSHAATERGGFRISEDLAKVLGWAEDNDPEPSETGTDADPDTLAEVAITSNGFEGVDSEATQVDNGDVSPAKTPDTGTETDYTEWAYNDLRAEVSRRQIDVPDQKTETLVAALTAYDESVVGADDDATL